jgi:hypothetical protein
MSKYLHYIYMVLSAQFIDGAEFIFNFLVFCVVVWAYNLSCKNLRSSETSLRSDHLSRGSVFDLLISIIITFASLAS